MKINDVASVCEKFLPGVERPINEEFEFMGERFHICTYRVYRGNYGLKGEETPNGYFIGCSSDWLDFHIDVYPERGTYVKRIGPKKYCKDKNKYERNANIVAEIETAFIGAIVIMSNS